MNNDDKWWNPGVSPVFPDHLFNPTSTGSSTGLGTTVQMLMQAADSPLSGLWFQKFCGTNILAGMVIQINYAILDIN